MRILRPCFPRRRMRATPATQSASSPKLVDPCDDGAATHPGIVGAASGLASGPSALEEEPPSPPASSVPVPVDASPSTGPASAVAASPGGDASNDAASTPGASPSAVLVFDDPESTMPLCAPPSVAPASAGTQTPHANDASRRSTHVAPTQVPGSLPAVPALRQANPTS